MRPEYMTDEIFRRFLSKIPDRWMDECWEWQGTLKPNGYGAFIFREDGRNRTMYAHRIAYEIYYGSIPAGLHIDHLCFQRRCVNPLHLEAVTQAENNLRSFKGRCKSGRHPMTEENTLASGGKRRCRLCHREWQRANRAEKKRAAADYLERAREAA